MTRRKQIIEQVAGLIADAVLTFDEAKEINDKQGWTFEVRWHDGDYINETDYTRVEGERLSGADLTAAWDTLTRWERGDVD